MAIGAGCEEELFEPQTNIPRSQRRHDEGNILSWLEAIGASFEEFLLELGVLILPS